MAKQRTGEKTILASFRLPPAVLERLRAVAAVTNEPQSALAAAALECYLAAEIERRGIARAVRTVEHTRRQTK